MRATEATLVSILGVAIVCSIALVPSRVHAQACPANSEPYSSEETATGTVTHCQCISGFVLSGGSCEPQPAAAPKPATGGTGSPVAFCTAKTRLNEDRNAIARLGFASNAANFEDYATQATNYRNDFVLQAADSLFNVLFVDKAVEYAKSLNPISVNARIGELRAAANGGSTDAIESVLRALARVRNKPAMAPYASNAIGELANKLFETIKDAKFNVETKHREDQETPRIVGTLILVGKLATKNPWASLTITGVEMARTAAMAYGISQNVDRLADLNDQEMKQLEIYRKRLDKDLTAVRTAEHAWQHATGQTREPNCSLG